MLVTMPTMPNGSRARARRGRRRTSYLPATERLEARALLTSFLVSNTNDSGPGSFRQAIINANRNPGPDQIRFGLPGGGTHTISPKSPLPTLTGPVLINGFSQRGASPNTSTAGDNAVRLVVLDGSGAGNANGLTLAGGNSTVQGLVIEGFSGSAVAIVSRGGNTIAGNAIGTDAGGNQSQGNGGYGVYTEAPDNLIGGTSPGSRNVISDNTLGGVVIGPGASANTVSGNFIGTNAAGTEALGNGTGVKVVDSPGGVTVVDSPGNVVAHNLISGNDGDGVLISGAKSTDNQVQRNDIGTNTNGTSPLGDKIAGVVIENAPGNAVADDLISGNPGDSIDIIGPISTDNTITGNLIGTDVEADARIGEGANGICIIDAPSNQIGGVTASARNVISGTSHSGVLITGPHAQGNSVQGNYIGTDGTGSSPMGNGLNGVTIKNGASGNMIGGTEAGAGNTIAFNGTSGTGGGVVALPSAGAGNKVLSNRIFANSSDPTTPAPGETGRGPVTTSAPVILSAVQTGALLSITGTQSAPPGTRVLLRFFRSGPGRGAAAQSLGSVAVTTDQTGRAHFTAELLAVIPFGQVVTATATSPGPTASSYSAGVAVRYR
jgi:hypothetical protein